MYFVGLIALSFDVSALAGLRLYLSREIRLFAPAFICKHLPTLLKKSRMTNLHMYVFIYHEK